MSMHVPHAWVLTWFDPKTRQRCKSSHYHQRSKANGAMIMLKAQGMLDVRREPIRR